MSFRTGCCKKFSFIVALLAMAILAAPAFAQTCLKDEYGKNVQCTANDVRVAYADNPRALDGTPLTSCIANQTFSFVADFHVVTTATARENIGLYFQTAGGANALTGTCSDNIIAPPHKVTGDTVCLGSGATAACTGNGTYEELDTGTPTDTCGDISTSDNNQVVTVEVDNALCVAAPGTNQLRLPNCTSWQQPGGTILCQSPSPNWPWVKAAIPGSPSKCNCDNTFTVPIAVQSPQVGVTKTCSIPSDSTQTNLTSCTLSPEGGDVTYTVTIQNTSNFGDIAVDQVCDTAYGTVYRSSSAPALLAACGAGSVTGGVINSTTCNSSTLGDIASTGSCTFTVTQVEATAVNNIVSVSGHGLAAGTFGPSISLQVTVVSHEVASTATTTKTFVSTTNVCATVRYGVDVKNMSGADETLTLSKLNDDGFGDITTVHDNVLGTTCGANGLGTLSGPGAGALPATIAVGGDYTCQFDATFCAVPGTLPPGTTCNPATGIQHKNTVTPTLAGDEGGETVTDTIGSLTVTECISAQ
jgi:hypothetical protein